VIIHTKHQGSRLCGFREGRFFKVFLEKEDFLRFFCISLCHYLNKLGRGPLGHVIYPIWKVSDRKKFQDLSKKNL